MSTEWTEETVRPHMFTEVEVSDDGRWVEGCNGRSDGASVAS